MILNQCVIQWLKYMDVQKKSIRIDWGANVQLYNIFKAIQLDKYIYNKTIFGMWFMENLKIDYYADLLKCCMLYFIEIVMHSVFQFSRKNKRYFEEKWWSNLESSKVLIIIDMKKVEVVWVRTNSESKREIPKDMSI